uniref:Putative secreted protein n=1 Tax=Anopheles triannulatus TaxID=58253 RepID=A0A2M4B2R1_9DIPT
MFCSKWPSCVSVGAWLVAGTARLNPRRTLSSPPPSFCSPLWARSIHRAALSSHSRDWEPVWRTLALPFFSSLSQHI